MAEEQLVVFCLGEVEYGVEISQVQEIVRVPEITKVPNTSEFVEGIVSLRGNIVPLVNLRKIFGLEQKERDENNRIIIVSMNETTTGVIVDSVSEVLRIEEDKIMSPPEISETIDINKKYLKGIGEIENRLLMLLDLYKILDN